MRLMINGDNAPGLGTADGEKIAREAIEWPKNTARCT